LLSGDNSAGGEIWCSRNCLYPDTIAEDSVSIRAIRRVYAREAGLEFEQAPQPYDIFKIAQGEQEGNQGAAIKAWDELSTVLADVIGNGLRFTDGLVVIGGGLSGAWPVFMPMLIKKLNEPYNVNGNVIPRMETEAFNLEDEADCFRFAEKSGKMITVPFSDQQVWYDPTKRVGVGVTKLGTSSAVAVGAYAFAMHQLEQ
jgi:glucokinase